MPRGQTIANMGRKRRENVPQEKIHPFVKKIREERIKKNITLKMLADKSGYCMDIVSSWERGQSIPKLNSIEDIANTLGYELIIRPMEKK
jgi:transcriptional regulator with XRE-family HTH domain